MSKGKTEKQYWAKGTGFGTGSMSSTWDVEAMMAHQQLKELLTTLSLAILAEYLHVPSQCTGREESRKEEESELLYLLEGSCLLPALATCLMNDSGQSQSCDSHALIM